MIYFFKFSSIKVLPTPPPKPLHRRQHFFLRFILGIGERYTAANGFGAAGWLVVEEQDKIIPLFEHVFLFPLRQGYIPQIGPGGH